MKRLLALLLALSLLLCSCGSSVADTLSVPSVDIQTEQDVQSVLENISDIAGAETADNSQSEAESSSAPAESEKPSAPAASTPAASQSTAPKKESDAGLKPSAGVFDDDAGDVTDVVGTVTVSVDCSAAVEYGSRSGSGTILNNAGTDIDSTDTAFSVMLRACRAAGISVSYSNTSYGIYVEGIDGLSQLDCGPKSGWMVRVNGADIPVSAGQYSVSDGDSIEWYYVTTY